MIGAAPAAPIRQRTWALPAALGVSLGLLAIVSLFVGRVSFSPLRILSVLSGHPDSALDLILWHLRLPRTLLAVLVGASLGLSGAALQGLLRNPLAEPGVIGVSTSAAFGAVTVFYGGFAASFALALPIGGMAGAVTAVALLMGLAGRNPGALTLILAGVAINSLAGSLTALVLNLSPNPYAATEIVFWMMGSLADRSFEHVGLAAVLMVPGWVLLLGLRHPLDALTLGEDAAASLGVNLRRVHWQTVLGTALVVGGAVAVSGAITFVGLVVPHLLRPLVGHEPGRLLPVSALGGALLLLATDIVVRLVSTGPELKIGVLTALIGAPFFLVLLLRMRRVMQ